MLERIEDAPTTALALAATGTVMARDVGQAVEAGLTPGAAGLVVVIGADFDGYMAEIERGLAEVAAAHARLGRIALVVGPGQADEARVGGPAAPIRVFAANERRAALDWAGAAR